MTSLVMEYAVSPIGGLLVDCANGFRTFFEVAGRSRAAAELTGMGMYEEARRLMMEVKEIRGEK